MSARIVAAVIALTALACVVAAAGHGPLERTGTPQPYVPSREQLREVGVITDDYPIPGQMAPEVFPADAWGLHPPGTPAWLPWALVGLVLLWLGVRLVREPVAWRPPRRRAPAVEPEEEEEAVLRDAVDAALVPLREPADPRAAVIEAYARMEQALAERRLGRRASEAPREYLRRVLRERGAPEQPLSTLTALFEEARFSRHPIPESAPERAAGALRALANG